MKVAIYTRSSKDSSDGLSVKAQERQLREWAKERGDEVVAVYSDTELSGTLDETIRPGLGALLDRAARHDFRAVLVLDSSRIARDVALLGFVESKLGRAGATLDFKNLPMDPASAVTELVRTVLAGIDRLHSRTSKEKGMAAMREAVLNGYRAGGRAPFGYKREVIPTGAVRNGSPVTRTRLALDPDTAPIAADYLKRRAAGESRAAARDHSGIKLQPASLVSLERNAMVYAGFTVWNTRTFTKPSRDDAHKRTRYNPESARVISPKPSHPALITLDEAKRIAALPVRRARRVDVRADSLLGGLLRLPDGRCYQLADKGKAYRAPDKGRRVAVSAVDEAVMFAIARDARSKRFVTDAVNAARSAAEAIDADGEALRDKLAGVSIRINRVVDAIAEGASGSLTVKLRELEAEKARLEAQLAAVGERAALKAALEAWEPRMVQAWFEFALSSDVPRDELRARLRAILVAVELDPADDSLILRYRFSAAGCA